MNVRLVLMRKRKRVWSADLHGSEATLGRAYGCTVRIPSAEVSRLHCRLHIENGLVTVEDLESVNGTFVNGKRVRDVEVIHPGDRLELGPVTFAVEYELPTESLRHLDDEGDREVVEAETGEIDVEIIDDANSQAKMKPPPKKTHPLEASEETDADTFALLGEEEEVHLPDNDALRDFLIELDDTEEHSDERKPKTKSSEPEA